MTLGLAWHKMHLPCATTDHLSSLKNTTISFFHHKYYAEAEIRVWRGKVLTFGHPLSNFLMRFFLSLIILQTTMGVVDWKGHYISYILYTICWEHKKMIS